MVCLPRLVGLDDERGERPEPARDEAMVDGPDREQHRDRSAVAGVGEQQRRAARTDEGFHLVGDPDARGAQVRLEGRVDADRAEPGQRVRVEEEALELGAARVLRAFVKQRRAAAEDRAQRERVPLAQVVDRRVRHLREALAEVRVQRPRTAGERRQRGVVAHRRGRLVPAARDRPQDQAHVLARVAELRLAPGQVRRPACPPATRSSRGGAPARASARTAGARRAGA